MGQIDAHEEYIVALPFVLSQEKWCMVKIVLEAKTQYQDIGAVIVNEVNKTSRATKRWTDLELPFIHGWPDSMW